MREKHWKCNICGKWIGYNDKYTVDYTPDTEVTVETYKIVHNKCKT